MTGSIPPLPTEADNYNALIVETREAFSPHGLTISAAIAPWMKLSKEAVAALEAIHLMAYDGGRRHSTLAYAEKAIAQQRRQGVPAEKLYLGLPFYGRKMEDTDQAETYARIVQRFAPKPEADEAGGYYFNGPKTIAAKVDLARKHRLGGVMIWEISADTPDQSALLRVIADKRKAAHERSMIE